MRLFTGPRLLVLLLTLIYVGFLAWYGGRGTPLTPEETERYLAEIAQRAGPAEKNGGHGRERLFTELRRLAASDDGNEFLMLNLIQFRDQAQYPQGSPYGGTAREADERYNRAIVPVLFQHGGHPVFLADPQGRFIHEESDIAWDRSALVRYRSRRDLLEIVLALAATDIGVHKWAAIEHTQVFPVRPIFSLIFVRAPVGLLLIVLGGLLHLALRRRAWYAGR